ncbi:MAG: TonB family protein [Proteobacteria bacterium]|nr:TonB family protein [Pseudomonadota bacterium]
MAYVDAVTTSRRLETLGVVAALHLVAGYVLVTGLAAKFLPHPELPRVIADNLRLPPPKPPKEHHRDDPKPQQKQTVHETHTPIPLDQPSFTPVEVTPFTGAGTLGSGGHGVDEVRLPKPDTAPSPTLVRGAKPRGSPGLWVTPNDYPASELRLEHSGVTRFRLGIGADGRVSDCTITASSGFPALDQAVCSRLTARARFDPAIDSTGARITDSYSSSVRWQIPE